MIQIQMSIVKHKGKGKFCIRSYVAHQVGAYPNFCSMKRLGIFLLPPGTHLYTWVERGTVRVKCLAHEHNAMSPARSRTRTARSGVERTNHEATAPQT